MVYYLIELESGYYYLSNYSIETLKTSRMNNWIKLHAPIKVIQTLHVDEDTFDDDSFVLDLMEKYGVDKVRGGTFISVELSDYQKRIINKRFNKFVQPNNRDEERYNSNTLFSYQDSINQEDSFQQVNYSTRKLNSGNSRNDRDYGVDFDNSKSYICSYCEMSFDFVDVWRKHEDHCKDSYYTKPKGKGTHCSKCGRDTHVAQFCKATTNILGHAI